MDIFWHAFLTALGWTAAPVLVFVIGIAVIGAIILIVDKR